jgi:hypothetical protein
MVVTGIEEENYLPIKSGTAEFKLRRQPLSQIAKNMQSLYLPCALYIVLPNVIVVKENIEILIG